MPGGLAGGVPFGTAPALRVLEQRLRCCVQSNLSRLLFVCVGHCASDGRLPRPLWEDQRWCVPNALQQVPRDKLALLQGSTVQHTPRLYRSCKRLGHAAPGLMRHRRFPPPQSTGGQGGPGASRLHPSSYSASSPSSRGLRTLPRPSAPARARPRPAPPQRRPGSAGAKRRRRRGRSYVTYVAWATHRGVPGYSYSQIPVHDD
jgi:hypothetical protein